MLSITRHRVLAEDAGNVASDALLCVYEHLGVYRCTGPFGAWVATLTRRLVSRYYRRRRAVERLADHRVAVDACAAVASLAVEDRDTLRRELAKLPKQQRLAVVWRLCEAASYRQIAATLDITEAAARRLVERARAALIDSCHKSRATGVYIGRGQCEAAPTGTPAAGRTGDDDP